MKSTCPPHRWLIDTPAPGCDGIVNGTCRKCGLERPHPATFIGDREPHWGGGTIALRGSYPKRKAAGGRIKAGPRRGAA